MLGFGKNKTSASAEQTEKSGLFKRLRDGLSRTRHGLTDGLSDLVLGSKSIDDNLLEEVETQLLVADIGMDATRDIIDNLTEQVALGQLKDADALMASLQTRMQAILAPGSHPLEIPDETRPFVILMVGINGAGKTTTIGKLAHRFQQQGKKVMLAAGDTFRAAAVEQLQTWGERNDVPVIAQKQGADSASVIFDALESARARDIDILIADTAGRLHTQSNLMEELKKVQRVVGRLQEGAPHEVLLVLDATAGQNGISQARGFSEAAGCTGLVLAKLDGTAKGGVIMVKGRVCGPN